MAPKRIPRPSSRPTSTDALERLQVAHDFNNALCVVLGNTELALEDSPPDDPRRAYFVNIAEAAERAAKVTEQLLAFSRQQLIKPEPVDIGALLERLLGMLRRLLGEDLLIETRVADDCGRAQVDPNQLEQVVINLALNARDAMPRGGRLEIAAREVSVGAEESADARSPARATMPADLEPGRYVLLSVSDSGAGIDPADLERIFEPFFTTKALGKGTGLGLATVFGVARQHGGSVDVLSAPGRGSTFRVFLPVARSNAEAEPSVTGADQPLPGGDETVLLVEDDELVRQVAHNTLLRLGYRVLAADSAEQALELAAGQPTIDLLLTDVVMPNVSGAELAEQLRERRMGLKVLYTSGYPSALRDEHGRLPSGIGLLPKPFTPTSLASRVRAALDS